MKVGNLIKVQYPHDAHFAGELYMGIITGQLHGTLYRMWCFHTATFHIINPFRDTIEVLN